MSESDVARKRRRVRQASWGAVVLATIGIAAWLLTPKPLPVETALAVRGPMDVTVDEEGEVRVHDRYEIAAPVAGTLVRVDLHDGDAVQAGDVVAELLPAPLDPRERDEALARVAAARALVREADQNVRQADVELAQARRERGRMDRLAAEGFIAQEAADKARTAVAAAEAALAAARARRAAAQAQLRAAEAALLALPAAPDKPGRHVKLTSPVSGRVLRILQKSARTVPAGTTVMVIGDPSRFEIVVDVLSTDAVRIAPGAPARLEEWGGNRSLRARVRTIEPYAFTKVSALGIEEQRVNIVLDPIDPIDRLGDGYKVETRIVVWSASDVLKVPASTVFRRGDGWAVFVVDGARARLAAVKVGNRNAREAEILEGLKEGAVVIRYPSNEIADGTRVRVRTPQ